MTVVESDILLDVRNLKTYFYTYEGIVKALEGVTFKLKKGTTLGLVGETGCGKSVTALSILRLVPSPPGKIEEGEVIFDGKNLLELSDDEMRHIRGKDISIVFQDPMTYLNPVFTIGDQIMEVILLHQDLTKDVHKLRIKKIKEKMEKLDPNSEAYKKLKQKLDELESMNDEDIPKPNKKELKEVARQKAIEVLKLVKMPYPEKVIDQYPHELSGGMRQRAMIAMMISTRPKLLIADEATTALDVTVQAQILNLLNELKKELNSSVIFITHDLGIVAQTCDYVAVMYAGRVIEYGPVEKVFKNPLHPYTRGLMNAIPKLHEKQERLETIPGNVPNLINPPTGCRFHPRCTKRMDICDKKAPPMIEIEPEHFVACYLYTKEGEKS